MEWEYVFCDGQLDFDMIQGGERRKNILRIEIEDADAIAPIQSTKLDGYRHLEVRDYSSMNEKSNVYGIATRLPEKDEKEMILFEPTSRMDAEEMSGNCVAVLIMYQIKENSTLCCLYQHKVLFSFVYVINQKLCVINQYKQKGI